MNILSAIYSGTRGLLQAKENTDIRAGRIAQMAHSQDSQQSVGADLVGLEIDKASSKASARVVKVSDEIMKELTQIAIRKR